MQNNYFNWDQYICGQLKMILSYSMPMNYFLNPLTLGHFLNFLIAYKQIKN